MLKNALLEWNPWWTEEFKFNGIKREHTKEIIKTTRKGIANLLLGMRRVGKTYTLYEIIDYLIRKKIDPKNILFIKVDDYRLTDIKKDIFKILTDIYPKLHKTNEIYLFLDEIQELPNWEKFLKTIIDLHKNWYFFVTGSNSGLLKSKISYLSGRITEKNIFPLNFREIIKHKNIKFSTEMDLLKNRIELSKEFDSFMENSSLPEIFLEEDKQKKRELLENLIELVLLKDLGVKYNIRNPSKLINLVKYLISTTSNAFNFHKISSILSISKDSISEYIDYLENVFLLIKVLSFDYSIKKQLINPKKLYFIDYYILKLGFNFSNNNGKLLENLVAIELKRRNKEIYYYKGKKECDFLIKQGTKITEAIQVCYELNEDNRKRELKGLKEAMKEFKLKKGLLLTYDQEDTIDNITVKPVWKWLLKTK